MAERDTSKTIEGASILIRADSTGAQEHSEQPDKHSTIAQQPSHK
jgi:hypothetical protein